MARTSPNVLITGATGFLGSHLAEEFLAADYAVMATRRTDSDLWRCAAFAERLTWINVDEPDWTNQLRALKPSVIIHGAWSGVLAGERMDWPGQLANLSFLTTLLTVAEAINLRLFIGLGSQAEYGIYDGKVSETHPVHPVTAYGVAKLMAYELVRGFFNRPQLPTKWYWLRLFTCFGEREDGQWLIPSMIQKMKTAEEINLTAGEQRSAYLYVRDFTKMVAKMVDSAAESGVYNLSSSRLRSVRELILELKGMIGSESRLNFGALPYRPGQAMHMEGDMTKFIEQVGPVSESDFRANLQTTVSSFTETANLS